MARITLDPERIMEGITGLKTLKERCLDAASKAASILKPLEGENQLVDDALQGCVNFQATYNTFAPSVTELIKQAENIDEIATIMSKAGRHGTVAKADASFSVKKVNPDRFKR